jgi:hypothetical protein
VKSSNTISFTSFIVKNFHSSIKNLELM